MRWLCCVALVLCVCASSALDDLPWWKTANLYQVYPRSFKDTDGNGVGDLKGITEKADYFKEIGLDALWLSPVYKSPMIDAGYDISDFCAIDPLFGTMDDFDALVKKLKDLGIKLVMDFVPNHTSDEHEWFQKSLNVSSYPDYRDFYVWMDPKGWDGSTPIPPNNWFSMFGGSAWEWRDERKQFYLHQFSKKQPDLNYRNPLVWGNVTAVLSFWMDKGVDGFRLDAMKHVYENASFPDEPPIPGTAGDSYQTLQHIYEVDQPEMYNLTLSWAEVVQKRIQQDGQERVVLVEHYDSHDVLMKYYNLTNNSMVIPFNFDLLGMGSQAIRPANIKWVIESWLTEMPTGGVANWVVGNHDNVRVADRYGSEMVDSINLLAGFLPGIKVTYNGEEIGMHDSYVRPDQIVDNSGVPMGPFFTRDPARAPMQWDSTPNSGFTTNLTTWLPVNPDYWWLNVATQRTDESSHLKVFQAMAKSRKDPVLQRGDLTLIVPNNDTLVAARYYNDTYFTLIINMGSNVMSYSSENLFMPNKLDIDMSVVVGSINSGYKAGTIVKRGSINLTLRPKAAVLLRSYDYGATPSSSSVTRPFVLGSLLVLLAATLAR